MSVLHYASKTPTCDGGRNDVGDWSRVTCPACLASLDALTRLHLVANGQGRQVYLHLDTDGDVDLHITESEDRPLEDSGFHYTLRVPVFTAIDAGLDWLAANAPGPWGDWTATMMQGRTA